jgi:hypothetical protein
MGYAIFKMENTRAGDGWSEASARHDHRPLRSTAQKSRRIMEPVMNRAAQGRAEAVDGRSGFNP